MRVWLGILACVGLTACGDGNPFGGTAGDEEVLQNTVPESIRSDLDSVTYNPAAETLTVRGIGLDNVPFAAVYTRKPGLDRGGYEAYTAQNDPLDRHATAFVKSVNGSTGAITATGGQFTYYFRGGTYNQGAFTRPAADAGLVTYAGSYVGILNRSGDSGDLLPVAAGTEPSIIPRQAAETTGTIFLNVDFNDNRVNGKIFDRQIADTGQNVDDVTLVPTDIAEDGSFQGETERLEISTTGSASRQTTGDYAGVFGGTGGTEVAGSLYMEDHLNEDSTADEEQGLFVLSKCGTPGEDPQRNRCRQTLCLRHSSRVVSYKLSLMMGSATLSLRAPISS